MPAPTTRPSPLHDVDGAKLDNLRRMARGRQSLPAAIAGGIAAGLLGAFLWGALVGITGLQAELEWVPMIGIGFLVGSMVRLCGKGIDHRFAVTGALIACLASLLGSVGTTAIAVAWQLPGTGNFVMFAHADLASWLRLLAANTGWVDVVCLALTTASAYALSRYQLTSAELATLAAD